MTKGLCGGDSFEREEEREKKIATAVADMHDLTLFPFLRLE